MSETEKLGAVLKRLTEAEIDTLSGLTPARHTALSKAVESALELLPDEQEVSPPLPEGFLAWYDTVGERNDVVQFNTALRGWCASLKHSGIRISAFAHNPAAMIEAVASLRAIVAAAERDSLTDMQDAVSVAESALAALDAKGGV